MKAIDFKNYIDELIEKAENPDELEITNYYSNQGDISLVRLTNEIDSSGNKKEVITIK